ncbi:MAG: RNA polymerase sigma factor [Rubrivivax sp.]|nr:RNA polymerase sigma factor [Rubrivivax sp.]
MPLPTAPPQAPEIAEQRRADADLVRQARDGDAAAFATIMRRHNRLLFRTARGLLSDDAEAQDVVQETYLRAFVSMHGFRGDAALGTWLARIAINAALDLQRKKGRFLVLDADAAAADPEPEAAMSDRVAPESPEAAAARTELRGFLQTAIDRLPPIYRSVFMLRAVEELSVEETALCLGVSHEVVKTRFLRSRAMLRETLGARIEAEAPQAFVFAGARCDAVVAQVLAELQRRGLIRSG